MLKAFVHSTGKSDVTYMNFLHDVIGEILGTSLHCGSTKLYNTLNYRIYIWQSHGVLGTPRIQQFNIHNAYYA